MAEHNGAAEYRSLGAHNPIFRGHLFARARRLWNIFFVLCVCVRTTARLTTPAINTSVLTKARVMAQAASSA